MTRITVIIPSYNRKKYLIDCLQSVMAQRYAPFEVLVVDDGSTDGTCEIIKGVEWVQLIQQENAGPGAARNRGASEARGDYLAFLDSDDLWFPWTLHQYRLAIERHNRPAFLVGRNFYFWDSSSLSEVAETSIQCTGFVNFFEAYEKYEVPIPTQSACIRRDVFESVGGFGNTHVGEDVALWLRLGVSEGFVWIKNPPLSAQRQHQERITKDIEKSLFGVLHLVEDEAGGKFPGGNKWRHVREHRISAAARATSLEASKFDLCGAAKLFLKSMGMNFRQRRFKYLLAFPFASLCLRLFRIRESRT